MAAANRDQHEDTAIVFRIGLHLGDLIVDGDDLYGDGVNVAARLEAEAPPGGIVVSGDLHNAVVGRLAATHEAAQALVDAGAKSPTAAAGWAARLAARNVPVATTAQASRSKRRRHLGVTIGQ